MLGPVLCTLFAVCIPDPVAANSLQSIKLMAPIVATKGLGLQVERMRDRNACVGTRYCMQTT